MRKVVTRTATAVVLGAMSWILLAAVSQAQQLKIAYVDVVQLKQEYKEFRDAEAKFETYMAVQQAKADSMQQEMQQIADRLEKQDMMLTEQAKNDLRDRLMAKQSEYQTFANQVMGTEGEAAQKEYELSKPIIEKINTVIKLIALREGYAFILDSTAGTVLYGDEKYDITQKVLAELNK
jgi:outer membrane protein